MSVFAKAQSDSTMTAIRENTLLTAEHTAKDRYDYLAVAISVLAFIVGGITLRYTIKTYKSQKKTEANTTPSINRDIQRALLAEQLANIYEIYVYLFTLFFYLRKHNHKAMPSEHFWNAIHIDLDQFHENLFYSNMDEWRKFSFLRDAHKTINNDLRILRKSIENKIASAEENEKEYRHLLDEAGYILWAYKPVIEDIYHEDYAAFLKNYFFEYKNSKIVNLFKAKYVHDDSELVRFDLRHPEVSNLIGNDIHLLFDSAPVFETLNPHESIAFKQQIINDVCTVLVFAGYELGTTERSGNWVHFASSANGDYTSKGFIKSSDHDFAAALKRQENSERWYFYFKHFD